MGGPHLPGEVIGGPPGRLAQHTRSYGQTPTCMPVCDGGFHSSRCTQHTAIFSHVHLKRLVALFSLRECTGAEEPDTVPAWGGALGVQPRDAACLAVTSCRGQTGEQGPNPPGALRDEEEFAWEALSLLRRRETKAHIRSVFGKQPRAPRIQNSQVYTKNTQELVIQWTQQLTDATRPHSLIPGSFSTRGQHSGGGRPLTPQHWEEGRRVACVCGRVLYPEGVWAHRHRRRLGRYGGGHSENGGPAAHPSPVCWGAPFPCPGLSGLRVQP